MGGGDAGLDLGHQQVEHLGGDPPGPAHALEILRPVQGDGEMGALGGSNVSASGMIDIILPI